MQDEVIVLVAPSYDELTTTFAKWLSERYVGIGGVTVLAGGNANRHTLLEMIESTRERVVLGFFGHGDPDCFKCEPGRGAMAEASADDMLCSADDFTSTLAVDILGYCCHSSSQFGQRIRQQVLGRFLGFRGEIWLYIEHDEPFKAIVCTAADEILRAKSVNSELLARLRTLYESEHAEWLSGAHSGEEDALWVCMCLNRHLRLLDKGVG